MFKLQNELQLLWRYACAGGLNTVVGMSAIFLLMWAGIPPVAANIVGYLLGLILAFFVAKKFVFRSTGTVKSESVRYFLAFGLSFLCNLAALHITLDLLRWHSTLAQLASISTYVGVMFILTRFFVFSAPDKRKQN